MSTYITYTIYNGHPKPHAERLFLPNAGRGQTIFAIKNCYEHTNLMSPLIDQRFLRCSTVRSTEYIPRQWVLFQDFGSTGGSLCSVCRYSPIRSICILTSNFLTCEYPPAPSGKLHTSSNLNEDALRLLKLFDVMRNYM